MNIVEKNIHDEVLDTVVLEIMYEQISNIILV